MAKRFTETAKWADKWFRALKPADKFAWLYILDNCDAAGVIDVDSDLAEFQVGMAIDWDSFVTASEGRVERLAGGKLWIVRFVEFQYGELSDECKAHRPVFASLAKHRLKERVLKGYPDPIHRVQEQDKDKDKDKDKGGAGGKRFTPPTVEQVAAYCLERANGINPQKFVDHYQARGWKVKGGGRMSDWRAAVRTWEGNDYSRAGPSQTSTRERQREAALARLKGNGDGS